MQENYFDEKQSAFLYSVLESREDDLARRKMWGSLREAAEKQASIWARRIETQGQPVPAFEPSFRARLVAALIQSLGARPIRPILAAMKVRGVSAYSMAGTHERRHRGASSHGNVRAAVFGANDGLLSNASLMLGVAGAAADDRMIVLTGVAGLLAGAFSMAAGEFISVLSQRELLEFQIGLERDELEQYPEEEAHELAVIYEAKGLSRAEAIELGRKLIANKEKGLDTLAREELGLNPSELGSPWGAAFSSFGSFALGAIVPLLPFLALHGQNRLGYAIGLSAVTLFGIGAAMSLFTGRGAIRGGARMLLVGAIAATATHLIGRFLGVRIS